MSRARRAAVPAAFAFVLLVAAALRLYGLSHQSLWNDELSSWRRSSYANLADVIEQGVKRDVHPPGHHVLLYYTQQTLGDSEWALRLPSALAGLLSVAAIFVLGARIYSEREGVLAAAWMAAAWTPLYYSQEARPYALLLLLSILSFSVWFRLAADVAADRLPRGSDLAAHALVSAAACYVHYFGVLLVGLQAGYGALAFARRPAALLRVALACAAGLLLYLPWLPELMADAGREGFWIRKPRASSVLDAIRLLFGDSRAIVVPGIAAAGFVAWRSVAAARARPAARLSERLLEPTTVLLVWLVAPMAVAFVFSRLWTPVFTSYNLIISLPAACLLVARFPFELRLRRCGPHVAAVGAVALVLVLAADTVLRLDYYTGVHKQQWREAVRYVVDEGAAYADAPVFGCVTDTRYLEYYFERLGSPRRVLGPVRSADDFALVRRALRDRPAEHVWLIAAHRRPSDALLELLSAELREVETRAFEDVQVWRYEVPARE